MFAIERIKIIKNHLIKDQKVSVAKLSELLDVTEVTIRRDLEKLEKEGFLKRTHGGAVLMDYEEDPFMDEALGDVDYQLRQEIADTAFYMVEDHDTLLLLDGPTNLHIAKRLTKKHHLTIVTNDLRIALEFSNGYHGNQAILLGGDLDQFAVYGQMTVDSMQNFSFNHLFVEIDGLNEAIGMTVSSVKKATLIHQATMAATNTIAICPSKVMGEKSLYRIGPLSTIDKLITDSHISDVYKNHIYNANIPLYTSVEIYED